VAFTDKQRCSQHNQCSFHTVVVLLLVTWEQHLQAFSHLKAVVMGLLCLPAAITATLQLWQAASTGPNLLTVAVDFAKQKVIYACLPL
jgi:hypothetical protein